MFTLKSRTVDQATIAKIYFLPKGHSKSTSNFPFISSLEILGGATKHSTVRDFTVLLKIQSSTSIETILKLFLLAYYSRIELVVEMVSKID